MEERKEGDFPSGGPFYLRHVIGITIITGVLLYVILLVTRKPLHYNQAAYLSMQSLKRVALAAFMYSDDHDDYMPLGTSWHNGKSDQLCLPAPISCFSTWAWSVQPYDHFSYIFEDQTAKHNPMRSVGADRYNTFHLQYGYNYVAMSPFMPSNDAHNANQQVTAVSQHRFADPARTILMTSKWARSEAPSAGIWGTGFPGGMLADAAVDPPVCTPLPQMCFGNWGQQGFFDQRDPSKGLLLIDIEGRLAGGVAARSEDEKSIVVFADGHAALMSHQELAQGTNWKPNIYSRSVVITNPKDYLWSVEKR